MLENLLFTCGLNRTVQKVFLYLLEKGASIASVISVKIGLKRPTVYAALSDLVRMGLVTKHDRHDVTYFALVDLDIIPKIFENRAKSNFDDVKSAAKIVESHLQKYLKPSISDFGVFKNVTLESIEAVYAELEKTLLSGNFSAIFNPQVTLVGPFRDLCLNFLKKTAVTKPCIREIIVGGPMADLYEKRIKNKNHLIKRISKDKKIISDIILANESVHFMSYVAKEEVAIKITDKSHYQSMMGVFDLIWDGLGNL